MARRVWRLSFRIPVVQDREQACRVLGAAVMRMQIEFSLQFNNFLSVCLFFSRYPIVHFSFLSLRLVIFFPVFQDDALSLCVQCTVGAEIQKAREIQYFLKATGDVILTLNKVAERVQFGVITGAALESLLRLMNRVYLPTFMSNSTWPESTLTNIQTRHVRITRTSDRVH